jgi:hypothetical protein
MTNPKYGTKNLNPIVIGCDAIYSADLPYDITGYTFEGKVLTKIGKSTVATFVVVLDEVNDRVTWSLTDTVTALLSVQVCDWYLTQTDTNNVITKIFDGEVSIEKK